MMFFQAILTSSTLQCTIRGQKEWRSCLLCLMMAGLQKKLSEAKHLHPNPSSVLCCLCSFGEPPWGFVLKTESDCSDDGMDPCEWWPAKLMPHCTALGRLGWAAVYRTRQHRPKVSQHTAHLRALAAAATKKALSMTMHPGQGLGCNSLYMNFRSCSTYSCPCEQPGSHPRRLPPEIHSLWKPQLTTQRHLPSILW